MGRLVRPRPILVLTAEGFEFSYGLRSSRFVPWAEVNGISLIKIHSAKIFGVTLCHRKKYMASLPKVYRWIAKINESLGYPYPIQLNMSMAKGYKTEEIATMMRLYLNKTAFQSHKQTENYSYTVAYSERE